ncbi:MAG TPA: methyltransferase domain-containing protein, partial [Anaeromyxobacter sp.]|nr:methyltransferase domain-containing protein [Anaeromyxobacter sp.]
APAQPPPEVKAPTPERTVRKVNLCSGARKLSGYVNVDLAPGSDLVLDLEHSLLPFPDESVDVLVCMSAINYFTRARAQEILLDVHRVLRPGGIVRFGTQDLRVLTRRYLDRDEAFWCQKLPDGRDRFPGPTLADKLNEFFYGFHSHGKPCRFVHDFESLRELFRAAGFEDIFERRFRESALPDVDQIDNRPEQMFFMEASKASERAQEPAGRSAHRAGQVPPRPHPAAAHPPSDAGGELEPERAWQRLLSRLTKDPGDAEAARECAATLERQERFDDLALLWTRYLSAHPGDPDASRLNGEAKRRAAEHRAALEKRARGNASQVSRLRDHQNRVLPDREHLDAAMSWLCRAQDHNGRGGVSAMYTVATRSWAVDYPETTGYLIPTFLAYAELTGSAEHLARARRMAEWELAIQAPDGGAGEPVGVFGQSPRVFNTGQVLLGWLALHRHAPDPRYLDASRRAGDWISASIEPDGSWCRNTYRGPRAYKSRVAWALLELHSATGEERYREAAERAIGWTLSRALPNGWFADCSLSDPEKPWTHLIGYVLVGLQEALQHASTHIDRGAAEALLDRAAQGISIAYLEAKQAAPHRFVPLPGTFDRRWLPGDRWSCVTGTAQLEFFLRRLGQRRAEQAYLQTADALLDEVKRLHLLDGITDPDLHGGLPGSHPIEEGYCSGALPNWGVKFFADGLIQRLRPGTHLIG